MKEVVNQVAVNLVGSAASQASSSRPVTNEASAAQMLPASGKVSPQEGKAASAEVSQEQVSQAVSDLNDYVQSVGRDLQFSVDEDSGRTIIRVLDSQTQDIIRQIPAEEVLALAEHLTQTASLGSVGLKVEA